MAKPSAAGPPKGHLPKWLQYLLSIITILGFVFGIIGIRLSCASQEKRDLAYAVNPIHPIVVSSQQCGDIEVSYRGEKLGCVDISVAQVVVLNTGNQSIEQTDFLKNGVYIQATPNVKVLDASVIKVSRNRVEFDLVYPQDLWESGHVPINWRILEPNDGAMIQLIYLGLPDVEFDVIGEIKEISTIRQIDWKSVIPNITQWPESRRKQ
jgi:hypothetical protein